MKKGGFIQVSDDGCTVPLGNGDHRLRNKFSTWRFRQTNVCNPGSNRHLLNYFHPAPALIHPYQPPLKDKYPQIFQTGILDLHSKWMFESLFWVYVLEFMIRLDIRELFYTKQRVSKSISLVVCGCLLCVS